MPSTAPRSAHPSPSPLASTARSWTLELPGGRRLGLTSGRPRVMGVLNLTPDSFSDGGHWFDPGDPSRAVDRAIEMLDEGADLIDLGAESTRPGGGVYGAGAATVPPKEELARLLPVLGRLRAATEAPISVDTRKAAVAREVLAAGADLINDVGALASPELARVVAEAGCPVVLMHSRGELAAMQRGIHFDDVVAEVRDELGAAIERAVAAGVARGQVIVDPGIGFGKTAEQNLALVGGAGALAALGRPVLVGASRKSFLGAVTGEPPERRLAASLAAAARAAAAGAAILRVHDVAETVSFLAVWAAIERATAAAGDPPDGGDGGAP